MEKAIAEQMTQFCLGLNYDSIPSLVREKSKDLILDTLGICTRSASLESGGIILDLVRTWGGAAESSLVGSGTWRCGCGGRWICASRLSVRSELIWSAKFEADICYLIGWCLRLVPLAVSSR